MKKVIFFILLTIGSIQAGTVVFADTLDVRDVLCLINKPSYPTAEIY
ncbi:MAG: hypothetical protein L3J10_09905 [Sulfurimonas sp.]|nr:hypothetical protein [Sulfurimonas sp.]